MNRDYALGPFTLDAAAGVLLREGQAVALGARGVAVLRALVSQAPQFVSKDRIVDMAWPGLVVEESNLSVQISAIRRTLAIVPGAEKWLETLPRRGYRYIGPVVPQALATARSPGEAASDLPVPAVTNLTEPLTSFVGRKVELVEVRLLLQGTRLLTLLGVGGVGKTRLGLQAAREQLPLQVDGVWLVELAALADPALVPQAIATVLGIKEQGGRPLQDSLVDHLRNKQTLLLLDNAEHLVSACAKLADALLRQCPQLRLLVTSRERLAIDGEMTLRVPSLPMPGEGATVQDVRACESVQLFIERARFHLPGFGFNEVDATSLAALCRALDGIPLALELAAARIRSMSVAELLQRLDQRFRILTGGSRTAPRRQQTLRALIDWSYDLLTDAEKALLPRLSVFAGGWTLEAAEGVCSGEGIEAWEMLDLLTSLADKSLLSTEVRHGAARYGMLESVRQYARELLHAQPSATEWIQCHLSYFVLLGEEVEPQLNGPRPEASFARLDLEHGNLRAALTPNDGMAGEGARLRLQLASALWRFWSQRGHFSEGRHWLEAALTAAPDDGSAHRARALRGAGFLMYRQGDNGAAQACFERSLAISRALDDRPAIAAALCNMGKAARGLGNYAVARAQIEEALTIAREHSADVALVMMLCDLSLVEMDQGKLAVAQALLAEGLGISRSLDCPNGIALTLLNLGVAHLLNADLVVARQYLEESLDQYRKLGDPYFIAVALRNLAATVADLGDQAAACGYHAECLALAQRLGDRTGAACTLLSMGELTWQAGAPATALNLVQQGLTMLIELGDRRFIADAFEQIGYIALALSDPRKAARMWGWSDGLRQEIGAPLPACGRALYDERVTAARASISDDAIFDRLFQDGRQMTQVQAVEYALTVAPV